MLKHPIMRLVRNVGKVYKGWRLSTKLFIILSLITMSLFIVLQWNNLKSSRMVLREQNSSESQQIMLRSNQFLSGYYDNIKTILLLISSQPNLLSDSNINAELKNYAMYSSPLIRTLYVVTKAGNVYCSNEVLYDIFGNDKIRQICDTAENGLNGIQFTAPYYTSISSDTIAFFIPVWRNDAYQGVIVAEVNIDNITQNLSPLISGSNQSFIITGPDQLSVCYDTDSRLIPFVPKSFPHQIEPDFQAGLQSRPQGVNYVRAGGKDLMIYKSADNGLGWNIYILSDQKILNRSLSRLYVSFALSVILGLAFILASTFIISYFFTSPIRQLALKMDKLKMLDNLPTLNVDRNDETGQLIRSFNSMMNRINDLVVQRKTAENKKKEYEFKMLQSQIRPHFLYNTLACIGSLAKQHRDSEIQDTIRSLVGLLSFSFDKRAEFVTLKEEMTGLDMYINIQKTRYGDVFEVRQDIRPETESCRIPKLTLQPILENALFHGILPKQNDGLVTIRAAVREGSLHITIRDNGIGYSPQKALESGREMDMVAHDKLNSVGLSNINERIRLNYGEHYGLKIRGRKNVGTVVKLTLPIVRLDAYGHSSQAGEA